MMTVRLRRSLLQNVEGETAVLTAAYYGHVEVIRVLLAAGANTAPVNKVRLVVDRLSRP